MNVTRIAILGVAAIAAGAAAFLVRGMMGGGAADSQAAIPAINLTATDILVASADIEPGRPLTVDNVKWQPWPKDSIASQYITKDAQPEIGKAVESMFVRQPFIAGEPIASTKIVKAEGASFMSASLLPGKRAVSITISAESGAGGFILPNDRVDVIVTGARVGGTDNYRTATILRDVRVLAIDQQAKGVDDQSAVIGKTALLELSPGEAEIITLAQKAGTLSLTLRGLGETAEAEDEDEDKNNPTGTVNVVRYGIASGSQPIGGQE